MCYLFIFLVHIWQSRPCNYPVWKLDENWTAMILDARVLITCSVVWQYSFKSRDRFCRPLDLLGLILDPIDDTFGVTTQKTCLHDMFPFLAVLLTQNLMMFLKWYIWHSQRLAHNMSEIIWGIRTEMFAWLRMRNVTLLVKPTNKNRNVELSRQVPSVHLWVSSADEW